MRKNLDDQIVTRRLNFTTIVQIFNHDSTGNFFLFIRTIPRMFQGKVDHSWTSDKDPTKHDFETIHVHKP